MNIPFISDQILIFASFVLSIAPLGFVIYLHFRLRNLLGGTNARKIEDGMSVIRSELKAMQNFSEQASSHFQNIEKRLRKSIQGVDTLRFNPFKGTGSGGDQSFSTVFLNENGDGVVVSSLYSRERVSVFSKPIKSFASEYEMSEEEKQVVGRARESLKQK